jgi:hypothetical protein
MQGDGFLARLGQAEQRDTHRAQARQHVVLQQRQVAHAVRQKEREVGVVQTALSRPQSVRQAAWMAPDRSQALLGSAPMQCTQWHVSPQEQRIKRQLASTGGARTNAFYASETSKFNASQPNARRGQESSIVFGDPSPEEQQAYFEYLISR